MVSERPLRKGAIYFTIHYADEEMLYPSIGAYVYLGNGADARSAKQQTHFFQTTETYHDAGSWSAMSDSERERLGPEAVISCDADDLDLFSDIADLTRQLNEFSVRARTPNQRLERP